MWDNWGEGAWISLIMVMISECACLWTYVVCPSACNVWWSIVPQYILKNMFKIMNVCSISCFLFAYYVPSLHFFHISFVAESQCILSLVPVRNECTTLIGDGVVFAARSKIVNTLPSVCMRCYDHLMRSIVPEIQSEFSFAQKFVQIQFRINMWALFSCS